MTAPPSLVARLRLHAFELTNGGANAGQLIQDLLEAATVLETVTATASGFLERTVRWRLADDEPTLKLICDVDKWLETLTGKAVSSPPDGSLKP